MIRPPLFQMIKIYLGPATDIGGALTDKLLKPNYEVICCSTFCQLTPEDIQISVHQALHEKIDVSIPERLGPTATTADFPLEYLTLEWDPYEYGIDGTTGSPDYSKQIAVPITEQGEIFCILK